MTTGAIEGCCLTPQGWWRGRLSWRDGRIEALDGEPVTSVAGAAGPWQAGEPVVLPGFIDLHVHGGGGADAMDAGDAVRRLAATHARHGTTSLLATTMTAPDEEITAALQAIAPACRRRGAGEARVLGVHLEGPLLSPTRLGAQPAFAQVPTLRTLLDWCALAPIRVITVAPEVEGVLAMIPALVEAGMRVQIGHSDASYEQALQAFGAGASSATHLFNAMSPWHHRAPGLVGAVFAQGLRAELIPDLLHLHPGTLQAALRALPEAYAVTDATAAAGMPDGEFRLGRQRVHHCQGAVRLADGTLAGSALTMDRALRHLVGLGLDVEQASARLSALPARHLGLCDRGRLVPGHWADLVIVDPQRLLLRRVVVEGEAIEAADSVA